MTTRYYATLLGPRAERRTIEPGKAFSLGRDAACDLVLPDNFMTSKRHVELEVRGPALLARSVGVGGTQINGAKMGSQAQVRHGDQIQIGPSNVLIEVIEEGAGVPGEEPPTEWAPKAGLLAANKEAPPPAKAAAAPAAKAEKAPAAKAAPAPASAGDADPLVGAKVGDHKVVAVIAESRNGRLYHAKGPKGADVALKILPPEAAKSDTMKERFRREAEMLGRVAHPNVVKIGVVGVHEGLPYAVMEYVPGLTLAERLKTGPLGVRATIVVGIQIARALALVHEKDIVHRDVAPASILLTAKGIAKLFNFSFAKGAVDEGETKARNPKLTTLGDMLGEIAYSSPEQIMDPRRVDARSDLYSLGATLFHAIAGRPPFVGSNSLEIFRLVISQSAPRLSDVEVPVGAALEDVIARLLSAEPGDRYESAQEVQQALEDALLEATGQAPAEGAPPPASEGRAVRKRADTAFSGGFSGVELVEILQFLEFNRKTGTLAVQGDTGAADLTLQEGVIVGARAESGPKGGAAVDEALGYTRGTFSFRPGPVQGAGLSLRPSTLAVEVMRKRDEQGK